MDETNGGNQWAAFALPHCARFRLRRSEADLPVLVTLLRCIVNCTAYPIQALCGPFEVDSVVRIQIQ